MNILLTGGGGFLGGFLLPMLLDGGHTVTALTRSPRETDHKNLTWVQMDLADGVDTAVLPENVDGVIHLAQSPEYRNGPAGEPHVLKVNVKAYAELLKYAEAAGASKFVTASTGSVYEPFTGSMREDSLPAPTGFYGSSKFAAEILSGAYTGRMSICNLRVFFLFGPGQNNAFVARLISTVRAGEAVMLPVEGEGLVFVPTLAEDTARVFVAALENGWEGVYNVANPNAVSVKTLAETIGKALGKDVTFARNEAASPAAIIPPLDKLAAVYDMSAFHSLEAAARKSV